MSDDTRDRLRELEGDVEEFASGHAMHRRTGEVTDDDPLVCLLYLLARDELPVGTLEALIEDPNWRASHFAYCNGYLARWAQDAAERVRGGDDFGDRVAVVHECPGCGNRTPHPVLADKTWECDCGEKMEPVTDPDPAQSPTEKARGAVEGARIILVENLMDRDRGRATSYARQAVNLLDDARSALGRGDDVIATVRYGADALFHATVTRRGVERTAKSGNPVDAVGKAWKAAGHAQEADDEG